MEIFYLLEKLIYKMFTGIVEEIGKIRKIKENNLVIECKKVIEGSNSHQQEFVEIAEKIIFGALSSFHQFDQK